jgi:hypothetical protein
MTVIPTLSVAAGLSALTEVPVTPDAQEARDLLVRELAQQEYQSAKPTWFDYLASGIRDWFESLNFGAASGPSGLGMLVVGAAVVAAIVIAFLVFGRPRVNQRSDVRAAIFGDSEQRSSATMLAAALSASQRDDYTLAITEQFRAIAQGLVERGVLSVNPGTTAHGFGIRAGTSFPNQATAITTAATAFDDVRYLGRNGAVEQYRLMVALERELRATRPMLAPVGTALVAPR